MNEVDQYLANVTPDFRKELEHVRKTVAEFVPDAKEVISYGIPGFKYKNKYLIGYAGFKQHMSVFPGATPLANLKKKISNYKQSKGTIQFTLDNPLPESIIRELVEIRVKQIDG